MSDKNLEPCPFCAATPVVSSTLAYFVLCVRCEARGPRQADRVRAIEAWNKRPESTKVT